jgi:hypothetical protein
LEENDAEMTPYGRHKKVRFPSKTDCHPKKGYINWWETVCDVIPRKTMKRIWMRDLQKELQEKA